MVGGFAGFSSFWQRYDFCTPNNSNLLDPLFVLYFVALFMFFSSLRRRAIVERAIERSSDRAIDEAIDRAIERSNDRAIMLVALVMSLVCSCYKYFVVFVVLPMFFSSLRRRAIVESPAISTKGGKPLQRMSRPRPITQRQPAAAATQSPLKHSHRRRPIACRPSWINFVTLMAVVSIRFISLQSRLPALFRSPSVLAFSTNFFCIVVVAH